MAFEKKTARNMFAAGSIALGGALILLTVSFQQRLDERTQASTLLTDSAIRGKEVWEAKNCTNCHTRMGEGAYFAPDLTKVVTRRSEPWMRHFLKDPVVAYYGTPANAAGRRKMPNLHLTDDEVTDLIAFFTFIEGIDTNGWPPESTRHARGVPIPETGLAAEGLATWKELQCGSCHAVNGVEATSKKGPELTFAATRLSHEWMIQEILDPTADFKDTPMPFFEGLVDRPTAEKLVGFLEYVAVSNGGVLNDQRPGRIAETVPAPNPVATADKTE